MSSEKAQYAINYVAKQTGLTTHTIRMWERRYGAVTPSRADSRHRLYSEDDIERLRLLRRALDTGCSIGKVANLPNEELRSMLRDAYTPPEQLAVAPVTRTVEPKSDVDCMAACQRAILAMKRDDLDRLLMKASVDLSHRDLLEGLVAPLMQWLGDGWNSGELRIAHEHLASSTVRAFLERYRRMLRRNRKGPRIVVTTPAGQGHEIGAMLVSITAGLEGWCDFYFGPDMPATEIAKAAVETGSNVVAISAPLTGNEGELLQELIDLRECLPSGATVICGGPGVALIQDSLKRLGVQYVPDLSNFRTLLSKLGT